MKFTFVYDQGEDTALSGEPIPHTQGRRPQPPPPPAVRIALAAEQVRTQGAFAFDRTRATLERLWHTLSTLPADPVPSLEPDEFDQDELFRPQAFRAPTTGGGA